MLDIPISFLNRKDFSFYGTVKEFYAFSYLTHLVYLRIEIVVN